MCLATNRIRVGGVEDMNDNIQTADSGTNLQIVEGMTVFDAAGDKVGKLDIYNPEGGFLDIRKGWIFPKDIYVPVRAVARTDADGIYLGLYKEDLEHAEYAPPPAQADAEGDASGGVSFLHPGDGDRTAPTDAAPRADAGPSRVDER
jgi:hypothetical protein